MKNHLKLAYFAVLKLPTRMANSVHVLKMCQALSRAGADLTLIASHRGPAEIHFADYGIRHRFRIKNIWMPPVRVLATVGYLVFSWFYLMGRRPQAIYTRDFWSSWIFGSLGVPIVYECHEDPLDGLRRFFLRRTLGCSQVKVVVVISEELRRILLAKYGSFLRGKTLLVLPDGVDLDAYGDTVDRRHLKASLRLDPARPWIGYTGSLFVGRGIEIILEAARRLPAYGFLVAGGDDEELASLRRVLAERGLNNVTCTGHYPHARIPGVLKACDVLLMPYQRKVTLEKNRRDTAAYMSPLKMFEYMASGTPIVSSDLPVLREILTHEETAWLVAPDDVDGWCSAIQRLVESADLAGGIAARARERVRAYSWDRRARVVLEALGRGRNAEDERSAHDARG